MVNTSLTLDPSRINTYSIGFDRMFDSLMGQTPMTTNYPPYNIVKHSDDKYTIEIAVAGFSKDDIAVETKENTLTVQSKDSGGDFLRNLLVQLVVDDRPIAVKNFDNLFVHAHGDFAKHVSPDLVAVFSVRQGW